MATHRNVKVHTSNLEEFVILDDVTQENSINPRACISIQHVDEYENAIIGYLYNGQEFDDVWGQKPQAVETDKEGFYLLTSGYHTITALMNVIRRVSENPDEIETDDDGTSFKLSEIDTDFEVTIQVRNVNKKIDYKDAARFHASFSNVHGQPLQSGEKAKAAYNALSVMNLSKDEGDDTIFPFVNDRKLAAMIGVGKTTVFNQRQQLIQERFGVVEDESTPTTPSTSTPTSSADNVVDDVENLAQGVPATTPDADAGSESESDNTEALPLGEGVSKEDNRESGTDGIDLGIAPDADADADEDDMSAEEKAEVLDKAKKLFSGGDILKLQNVIKFRETCDFILNINTDQLSKSISAIDAQMTTAREQFSTLLSSEAHDAEYTKGLVEIITLFQIVLEGIADENIERG